MTKDGAKRDYDIGEHRKISDVVAENVGAYRRSKRLSQSLVAERMQRLGHEWTQSTASLVENRRRSIEVNELLALSLVLRQSVPDLLDPRGPGFEGTPIGIDYGGESPLVMRAASALVRGAAIADVTWRTPHEGFLSIELRETEAETFELLRAEVVKARLFREAAKEKEAE